MKQKIINTIIFLLVCAGIYGLVSHHFVFYGRNIKVLPKAELTLENTFVNVSPTEFRTPENILRNEVLRDAGVGDVMVEFGVISEEKLSKIEAKINSN